MNSTMPFAPAYRLNMGPGHSFVLQIDVTRPAAMRRCSNSKGCVAASLWAVRGAYSGVEITHGAGLFPAGRAHAPSRITLSAQHLPTETSLAHIFSRADVLAGVRRRGRRRTGRAHPHQRLAAATSTGRLRGHVRGRRFRVPRRYPRRRSSSPDSQGAFPWSD